MKSYTNLISESVEEVVPQDTAVEPAGPKTIEDAQRDPKVKTYLEQGYNLKGVSQDDEGTSIAMLVKGDYEDTAYVVLEMMVHGGINGNPKAYDREAKHYDQWIKQTVSTHQPNMRVNKYYSEEEPLDEFAPHYHRWEISWNSKPTWIVVLRAKQIDGSTKKIDYEPRIHIGIDGRGFIRGPKMNKMATRLDKLTAKGFRNYEQFRAALELVMDIFPESEIPEEYR